MTPARLLLLVWAAAITFYAFGPVSYDEAPRLVTWLFVGACILAFCVGSGIAARGLPTGVSERGPAQVGVDRGLDRIVRVTALVGLFGALCIAIDKVILSGLDFSQGVAAVRFLREQAVSSGTAGELRRSPLLYLGYVTFSFSVASYLVYLLKGDRLRLSTAWLTFISLASIFAYAYLSGGRSPLFLVLGMAGGAIVVRLVSRETFLPKGWTGRILFVTFVVLTFAYSNWILSERLAANATSNYAVLEQRFETTYDARVPRIDLPTDPSATGGSPPAFEPVLVHVVLYAYYFTHELPMLERTVAYDGQLGPYYGAYQFYLLSALVARLEPALNVDTVMVPQLQAAHVYGWFSTAWGGMYLDFGLLGAVAGVLLCGWLAGLVYRRARSGSDGARLLMCYVIAGIIATPILSIFTISISLPILASLLITSFFLRSGRTTASPSPARASTTAPQLPPAT